MTWTEEQIYRPDRIGWTLASFPPSIRTVRRSLGGHGDWRLFLPEFLAAFETEKAWIPKARLPMIPPDLWEDVGTRKIHCPICGDPRGFGEDSGERQYLATGKLTGIPIVVMRSCDCCPLRAKWYILGLSDLPQRFRYADLDSVVPSDVSRLSLPRQQVIIDHLRAHPDRSFFFFGDAGCSKTHFATALFVKWVTEWSKIEATSCPPVRVNTSGLLAELARKANDKEADEPSYSIQKVKSAVREGRRPQILLDEVDKFPVTEPRLVHLLGIVDAVYAEKGQICATSNLSPAELLDSWEPFAKSHGEAILRRIAEPKEGGEAIEFREPVG
jgi:hypothetical protein